MTARAVVDLLAGELHELHPTAYDTTEHPVDPAARHHAERLLAALADQGMTITPLAEYEGPPLWPEKP